MTYTIGPTFSFSNNYFLPSPFTRQKPLRKTISFLIIIGVHYPNPQISSLSGRPKPLMSADHFHRCRPTTRGHHSLRHPPLLTITFSLLFFLVFVFCVASFSSSVFYFLFFGFVFLFISFQVWKRYCFIVFL